MKLFPELEKRYSEDQYSTRESQRMAEFIAFGPVVFQATRLMLEYGILQLLRDNDEGLTQAEISEKLNLRPYIVKCLTEASLCIGTILTSPETDKLRISKIGWFLLTDPAAKVNFDFNNDVNYRGFFYLDESFRNGYDLRGSLNIAGACSQKLVRFRPFLFQRSIRPGTESNIRQACEEPSRHWRQHREMGVEVRKARPWRGSHHSGQFLDCFSPEEIVNILKKASAVMGADSRLCIMELLWDRQKYEPAAFCLTMTSLYFTAMANGNSKMYYSQDLIALIGKAGLRIEKIVDGIGQGHNILICRK